MYPLFRTFYPNYTSVTAHPRGTPRRFATDTAPTDTRSPGEEPTAQKISGLKGKARLCMSHISGAENANEIPPRINEGTVVLGLWMGFTYLTRPAVKHYAERQEEGDADRGGRSRRAGPTRSADSPSLVQGGNAGQTFQQGQSPP